MKRILFVLAFYLFITQISVYGQCKGPQPLTTERQFLPCERPISQMKNLAESGNDLVLAARIITALRRLDSDVWVYRSLGDFEERGRLARVSFEVFQDDLQAVTAEVQPLLSQLPHSKLKIQIDNALASYQDGAFWWRKIHQARTVNISTMSFGESTRAPSDTFFVSIIPYTVAIHWRQAAKYLKRAEELMKQKE